MKTMDVIIRESREFVCEHWGQGEASVVFYAPLTRIDGITWIHPAWAKEYTWAEITLRADRVWRVAGSLWNPIGFRLIWRGLPAFPIVVPAVAPTITQTENELTALQSEGGSRPPGAIRGRQP